jgi:neurotransmitter:Na+ symporter, NSS family
VTLDNLRQELATPYEGLPASFLATFGWGVALLAVAIGFAFTSRPWREEVTTVAPPEVRR